MDDGISISRSGTYHTGGIQKRADQKNGRLGAFGKFAVSRGDLMSHRLLLFLLPAIGGPYGTFGGCSVDGWVVCLWSLLRLPKCFFFKIPFKFFFLKTYRCLLYTVIVINLILYNIHTLPPKQ